MTSESYRLCELLEVTSSKRIHMADYVSTGVPFYRGKEVIERAKGNDISTELFIAPLQYQEIKRKFGSPIDGDILLTSVGTLGVAYFVSRDGEFYFKDGNVTWFRNFASKLNSRFLYYWLISPKTQQLLNEVSIGSTQRALTISALKDLQINLPSLEIQKSIADILDSLTHRITLLRETNSTLEAIAQALFKSWFVDFDPVRAKQEGRQPEGIDEATAALFPDGFEESELGLVPRGWRACTMEDVSVVRIGKTPPRKESHWFSKNPKDVRWVSIRDMGTSGAFISSTSEYLTAESIQRFNVRQVPNNTVLLSFKMTIGRVAITDGEMTTNEAIAHFKLEEQSQPTSEYIYLHLKQFDYTRLSSTSSIADAVNSKTVKAIPILVPNAAIALAFQDAISPIFEKIKLIQHQAQTLATLRDTLLPRLISGQLRLPEVDSLLEESVL